MPDMWIKLVFPGTNAIMGSLQGRVCEESFDSDDWDEGMTLTEMLNKAVYSKAVFKLFDPIQLHPVPSPQGTSTMTIPLIQALEPHVTQDFLWVNGDQVQWWAPFEVDEKWQQIVDQSIHGVSVPPPGLEIDEPDEEGGSNIIHLPGR